MATNGKKSGTQLKREIDEVLEARKKREVRSAKPARASGIPSQGEYERREIQEAQARLAEIRKASLSDRKEAVQSFFEAMRDTPAIVAERIGWLLDGNYGFGAGLLAKRVLGSRSMNRAAALTQMAGAFEWQAPEEMSRGAWKKLTASQQAALDRAVQKAIRDSETE